MVAANSCGGVACEVPKSSSIMSALITAVNISVALAPVGQLLLSLELVPEGMTTDVCASVWRGAARAAACFCKPPVHCLKAWRSARDRDDHPSDAQLVNVAQDASPVNHESTCVPPIVRSLGRGNAAAVAPADNPRAPPTCSFDEPNHPHARPIFCCSRDRAVARAAP